MRHFLTTGLILVASSTATNADSTSPIAEILCAPTAQMTQKLLHQFGAHPHSWGMRGPEQIMQVWTEEDGDWTMVVRYATGTSCIVAMGENWDLIQAENPA